MLVAVVVLLAACSSAGDDSTTASTDVAATTPGIETSATGPALVPVLQQTGLGELVWAILVAVPLFLVG